MKLEEVDLNSNTAICQIRQGQVFTVEAGGEVFKADARIDEFVGFLFFISQASGVKHPLRNVTRLQRHNVLRPK